MIAFFLAYWVQGKFLEVIMWINTYKKIIRVFWARYSIFDI